MNSFVNESVEEFLKAFMAEFLKKSLEEFFEAISGGFLDELLEIFMRKSCFFPYRILCTLCEAIF